MMAIKKLFILLVSVLMVGTAYGKKVKFSLDMTGNVIDTNGIHITGDFQEEAGYAGGDWQPNTTEMLNEAGTNIYSVTVSIPAFTKYEFKFLNGGATYGLEFVPMESRVDEVFNDNRWIYIDSLDNDTMKLAPIIFSTNAPAGLRLLRFKVDLQNVLINNNTGVHVSGNFQSFNTATTRMYSFDGIVFQYIAYIDTLSNEAIWKYVNGNNASDAESVPNPCSNGNNYRNIYVSKDTMLPVICYAYCDPCMASADNDFASSEKMHVYPNPFHDFAIIHFENKISGAASLYDIFGRELRTYILKDSVLKMERENLFAGIYLLKVFKNDGSIEMQKLIIE